MFRRSVPFLIQAAALIGFNLSLGMSRTIQGTFLVDELGVRPNEIAIVITARETVGFLTILLVAATMPVAPPHLVSICFVVMSVGSIGLFATFLGFALWNDAGAAIGLYFAYNTFILVEIGVNTYLKKVATQLLPRRSVAPNGRPMVV